MIKKSIYITLVVLCLCLIPILFKNKSYSITENKNTFQLMDSIDYSEGLEVLRNPERGFYTPIGYNLKTSENKALNPTNNLIHLRVGLSAFSGKVNNQNDIELTENALDALNQTFNNIRKNNSSVIIRFAYDNFNGNSDTEPSLEMILRHIEQLGPMLINNKDVIASMELGLFGPWGEMHSSKICSNENFSKAINQLLTSTNQQIKISVRTPGHYAAWRNIDRNTLNKDITTKGTREYQVGIYNDGYLGSENDLGTFSNRNIEIEWLSSQAKHTFYGGEIVANYASGTPLNTIDYLSKEAFKTHTTYLNSSWNDKVINGFKQTIYNGDNDLYKGQTAHLYIENHLGYRFVLKSSYLTSKITKNDPLKLKLKIENVGFANLIKTKNVSIILQSDDNLYEIKTSIDATTWNSKEITEENLSINLPIEIKNNEYNVYLRISENANILEDKNYHCISFANKNIYNNDLGANYIGKIIVDEHYSDNNQNKAPENDSSNNNNNSNSNNTNNKQVTTNKNAKENNIDNSTNQNQNNNNNNHITDSNKISEEKTKNKTESISTDDKEFKLAHSQEQSNINIFIIVFIIINIMIILCLFVLEDKNENEEKK